MLSLYAPAGAPAPLDAPPQGEQEQLMKRGRAFCSRTADLSSGVSAPNSASFPIRQPKGQHQNRHRSCLHFGRERPQQIRSNLKFGREEIRFLTIPVSLGKRRYLRNTISASSNSRPCACASLQLCISGLRAFKRGRENDFDRIRFNTRTSLIKPTDSD